MFSCEFYLFFHILKSSKCPQLGTLTSTLIKRAKCWSPVCMFDKFHLTFDIKSKVSRDIFKNKNECQLTSTFSSKMSPQCHMPNNTCHFNFQSINRCVVYFFTSHTTCQNLELCVSRDVLVIFVQVFCMSNVKNLQKLCQTCTLLVTGWKWCAISHKLLLDWFVLVQSNVLLLLRFKRMLVTERVWV